MFISRQEYDTVNARNVQLARENKELNEENKIVYEENRDLRYENEEQTELINKIRILLIEKGQGTIVDRFDKIKELVCDYQSQN